MIIVEDKKQNSLLNLKDLFSFKDTYFFLIDPLEVTTSI